MHPLQDLDYLSEGLEGRSQSPVALLFDALLRPDTDFGGNMESVLTWKHQKERAIPHVVLGRNLPGGAWHVSGSWERGEGLWAESARGPGEAPSRKFGLSPSRPLLPSRSCSRASSASSPPAFLRPPQRRPPVPALPTGLGARRGLGQRTPFAPSPLKAPW